MELVFLDRSNLRIKDYGSILDEFEIVQDIVIEQKSSFVIGKGTIKAGPGDIVASKDTGFFFLGIIDTVEYLGPSQIKVHCLSLRELFNLSIVGTNYEGDLAMYLENLISEYFINSTDNLQRQPYLNVIRETSITGNITYEADKLIKISDILEIISRGYGVNIRFELSLLRGRIIGINIIIYEATNKVKIKANLPIIQNLMISSSDAQSVNKVVFIPKSTNVTYKNRVEYYLTTGNGITMDVNHPDRFKVVIPVSVLYDDKDYETLETKASQEMKSTLYNHNINFDILTDNEFLKPYRDIFIGDLVEFITKDKTYMTQITNIKYKNSFEVANITLGEYRIKLTEKIKLLTKSVDVARSSVNSGAISNIDGGSY